MIRRCNLVFPLQKFPTSTKFSPSLLSLFRACSTTSSTTPSIVISNPITSTPKQPGGAAAAAAASSTIVADGAQSLSDFKDLSDEDKELLRMTFFEPEKAKVFAKHPMGDGGGAGNKAGDMVALFTCNICKLRSSKRFSKHSYTKGVVMVQCGGCGSKHLIADHLGWFEDEHKTIEDVLKARGEEVRRLSVSVHIDKPEEVALDAAEAALDSLFGEEGKSTTKK